MKAFQFTLQTLLDSRAAFEKVMEAKLAGAVRDLHNAQQRQRAMVARIKKDVEHMESFRGSCVSHHTVSSLLRYIERCQYAVVAQSQNVARAEVRMEECRNDLHVAMRGRKTIERLFEGEHEKWKEDVRRHEQKEMDEHARARYVHHKAGGADV